MRLSFFVLIIENKTSDNEVAGVAHSTVGAPSLVVMSTYSLRALKPRSAQSETAIYSLPFFNGEIAFQLRHG